jgi:hypothetical protein
MLMLSYPNPPFDASRAAKYPLHSTAIFEYGYHNRYNGIAIPRNKFVSDIFLSTSAYLFKYTPSQDVQSNLSLHHGKNKISFFLQKLWASDGAMDGQMSILQ